MKTMTTQELVQNPQAFLDSLEAGEKITLADGVRTVAEVIPAWKPLLSPRPIGLADGTIWISDDFNDPLPEDIQALWEGRHS